MARSSARQLQHRLGERIQTLRRDRELTQETLAQACGISQKYLSELERGEKAPSWETLVAIAHDGFQITLAALVYSIDEKDALDARSLDGVLAGRPKQARYDLLKAFELILRAGESK
ncbi:MAG: helix-turn-helix transcriptional regulator [Kofleriaceae bacterium]